VRLSDAEFRLILQAVNFAVSGHRGLSIEATHATQYGDGARYDFSAHVFSELLVKLRAMEGGGFAVNEHELQLILAAVRFTHEGMLGFAKLMEAASDIDGAQRKKRTAEILFMLQEKIERGTTG
jgi:hypothetical protein